MTEKLEVNGSQTVHQLKVGEVSDAQFCSFCGGRTLQHDNDPLHSKADDSSSGLFDSLRSIRKTCFGKQKSLNATPEQMSAKEFETDCQPSRGIQQCMSKGLSFFELFLEATPQD